MFVCDDESLNDACVRLNSERGELQKELSKTKEILEAYKTWWKTIKVVSKHSGLLNIVKSMEYLEKWEERV